MDVFLYSKLLALATVGAHIFLVVFLVLRYSRISAFKKIANPIQRCLSRYGLLCAFGTALFATVTPLIYTYSYHFLPCTLCWYQRIFMFPLVIILFLILKRKDFRNKIYVYALATIGMAIGFYHYLIQQLHTRYSIITTDCAAVGMSKSCSEYYFIELGYITIPLMSLTAFILIIFFTYFARRSDNERQS